MCLSEVLLEEGKLGRLCPNSAVWVAFFAIGKGNFKDALGFVLAALGL